jgi:type I restriction enzyme S subunit
VDWKTWELPPLAGLEGIERLGIDALARIKAPVPAPEKQRWFNSLLQSAEKADCLRVDISAEIDALMPAILSKAFHGEL